MSIVTDEKEKVNKSFDNGKIINKWSEKKRQSQTMAKRLYVAGLKDRAARMYVCGDYITTRTSKKTGEVLTDSAQLCRDRLCSICSWRLALRRFSEMMSVFNTLRGEIESKKYKVALLTLTIKNVPVSELRQCIDKYAKAWHNMSRRDLFRGVVGWSRSLEITYNAETDTYHPHYHCLLIWDRRNYTKDIAKQFCDAWKHAQGVNYTPIIDIREVYDRNNKEISTTKAVVSAALEAFKYSVKPNTLKNVPQNELLQFAEAIKGVRFVSYGKAIKTTRAALGYKNDDMAQMTDTPINDDELLIAVMRWNGTAYTKSTLEGEPWRLSRKRLELELALADNDITEIGGDDNV